MTEIPALTVRQPWAWAIARGHKPIENRTWSTTYRGPLAIHAAKKWDDEYALTAMVHTVREQGGTLPATLADDLPSSGTGRIVAVVDLVGICTRSSLSGPGCDCGPWAIPEHAHWQLANARLVDGPEVSGRLGLWRIDLDVMEETRRGPIGRSDFQG